MDADDTGSGACQFRDTPTGGRHTVGGTDTGFMYAYGPVPADARTVRLNLADGTTIEAQTAPLPPGLRKDGTSLRAWARIPFRKR